jgi:hypothetical protein
MTPYCRKNILMGDGMGKDDSNRDSRDSRDLDWENRVLCSDESCIGVIGADGRCKECGKPYEGELPETFVKSADEVQPSPSPAPDAGYPASEKDDLKTDDGPADIDQEWERRTLCRDESCIGVIGPDGLCKECGLPLEGE